MLRERRYSWAPRWHCGGRCKLIMERWFRGIICRQDFKDRRYTWSSPSSLEKRKSLFAGACSGDIIRKVNRNIEYIANLSALRQWYRYVRREFFIREKYGDALYSRSLQGFDEAIAERTSNCRLFAQNMETSIASRHKKIKKIYPDMCRVLKKQFLQDGRKWKHIFLVTMKKKSGWRKEIRS